MDYCNLHKNDVDSLDDLVMTKLENKFIDNCDEDLKFNSKLERVLSMLLQPEFDTSDETVLEKLFSHLFGKAENNQCSSDTTQRQEAVFVMWLCASSEAWSGLARGVRTFVLRAAGSVAASCTGLHGLRERDTLRQLCTLAMQSDGWNQRSSIATAYMDMLCAVATHQQGRQWIVEKGVWLDAVDCMFASRSLYGSRRARQFLSSLVVHLEKSDPEACIKILNAVLAPLDTGSILTKALLPSVEMQPHTNSAIHCKLNGIKPTQTERITASLNLVSQIIAAFLADSWSAERISKLIGRYNMLAWAWTRLDSEADDSQLLGPVCSLIVHLDMTQLRRTACGVARHSDTAALNTAALQLISSLVFRRQFELVLDCCTEYQALFHRTVTEIVSTDDDANQRIDVRNQLVTFQAIPLFVYLMKMKRVKNCDLLDIFIEKLFEITDVDLQRLCYQYRDFLRPAPDEAIESLCIKTLFSLMEITKFVKREQAVIVFQSMTHVLKEFVVPNETTSNTPEDCTDVATIQTHSNILRFPNLLGPLLDGIIRLVERFQFTWGDSLETLCLLIFAQALINNSELTPKHWSQALQLARVAITNFIPPNLALLVNTVEGSSIQQLGSQLYKKLFDTNWEVRDSSLEVVHALTTIAEIKFPALQSLLLDCDIPSVVVTITTSDSEAYVRATALVCLRAMVRVADIWDKALCDRQLTDTVLTILRTDTEGIVRREAASLIADIYQSQKIVGEQLQDVCDCMYDMATNDLHWEVKTRALEFWSAVIDQENAGQGMIDGSFPSVTFSQQSHKIVQLNSAEIKRRLATVLSNLSHNGCLQVLWQTLHDDCDLEVARQSMAVTQRLLSLLREHDMTGRDVSCHVGRLRKVDAIGCGDSALSGERASSHGGSLSEEDVTDVDVGVAVEMCLDRAPAAPHGGERMDKVIAEILNEPDISLLATCRVSGDIPPPSTRAPHLRRPLSEHDFLERVSALDLDRMIESRSKWLSSCSDDVDSLMDDILAVCSSSHDANHHISMDCY